MKNSTHIEDSTSKTLDPSLISNLNRDQWIHVQPKEMCRALLSIDENALSQWSNFKASWENLPLDEFMADQGRYRRRRFGVLRYSRRSDSYHRELNQPHYQETRFNSLNGGILRVFEEIEDEIIDGVLMRAVIGVGMGQCQQSRPGHDWRIEIHQFRIETHRANGFRSSLTRISATKVTRIF